MLSKLRIAYGDDDDIDLGIPQLEALLRSALGSSDHSTANAGSTTYPSTGRRMKLQRPVIELTSTSPGAGKTHLLYLLASHAVTTSTSGREHKATVVIDADNRFDVERLATVLRQQIRHAHRAALQHTHTEPRHENAAGNDVSDPPARPIDDTTDETQVEELVQLSLRHIHIFRPQSLGALVATLAELETYLFGPQSHLSGDRHVSAVLLDSASTFYWQHRADEDALRARRAEGLQDAQQTTERPLYSRLLQALRELQLRLDCSVVYTSLSSSMVRENISSVSRSFESAGRSGLRPFLPPSWSGYPTVQLQLQRARVAKFALGMGAREAWTDRDMRWEAVRAGQFTASITDSRGSQRKVFDFAVDSEGIRIEDGGHRQPDPGRS